MYSLARVNVLCGFVVLVYGFEYTVVALGVIVPWLNYSVPGVLNLALLTLTTGMGMYCYLLCVISDPGFVTAYQHTVVSTQIEVKKSGGSARVCQKCSRDKPPRAHHCRICKRCVMRMCHHCPWINNCVGHGNAKVFLLFLGYTLAALVQSMALLIMHVTHVSAHQASSRVIRVGPEGTPILVGSVVKFEDSAQRFVLWLFLQVASLAITLPLTIGLLLLFTWQVYLLAKNMTTIEFHEGVNASAHIKAFGQRSLHPYDISVLDNVQSVMGAHVRTWLIPSDTPGSGIKFAHNMAIL